MIHVSYSLIPKAVHPEVCRIELEGINWDASFKATVARDSVVVEPEIRKTDIVWAAPDSAVSCIAQSRLVSANVANDWGYVMSYVGDTQLGRYQDGGHYVSHIDTLAPNESGVQRKITAVTLLNDSTEFEGGDLELMTASGEWVNGLLKNAGDMVIFPSFLLHRVTPVTSGVRYTAVTWAVGPAFR